MKSSSRQLKLKRLASWVFLSTVLMLSSVNFVQCYARQQDFQTQRPAWTWQNDEAKDRRGSRRGAISSSNYQSIRQTSSRRTTYRNTISDHFLDDANWMADKNVRYWDVNLVSRRPGKYSWTTKLVFANVVCYGIQMWKPAFTNWGVKVSDKILRGEELYRLITPVFLHGNPYHLFTNLYSLNNIAPTFERMVGSGRFVAGFLVSGIAGNLLSAYQSPNPALGASGAVFGVMAGFFVFLNRHDWLLGPQARQYSDSITSTLLLNLGIGFMNPVVDNWGHIGGAIGGALFAHYFGPRIYLTYAPGASGGNVLVDKPILRLPRYIESIPENTANAWNRATRKIQFILFGSELGLSRKKPWRNSGGMGTRVRWSDYRRRRLAPNKSIKPKHEEDE